MLDITSSTDPRLSLSAPTLAGDVAGIAASGEIDASSAPQLHRTVVDALRLHRPSRIELDMSGVSFLDSSGLECLLLCHADARQLDCRLILTRPQPMTRRVLEITGLSERLGVTPR